MKTARETWSTLRRVVNAHKIALAVLVGLLLLYTLAGFLLVPRIARAALQDYATETLHRKLTLGELRFNPFTFVARLRDFHLAEADGEPLVAFRSLLVNVQLASVWQRALHLKEVRLVAPDVRIVISPEGRMNLAALAPPSEPAAEPASGPPRVRIDLLSVTDGRMGLEDRSREQTFKAAMTPIRFTLTDFRTDAGYDNFYRFIGTTLAGEQFDWSGSFTVQPLASKGYLKIGNLRLAELDSYLCEALPARLSDGLATLQAEYGVALDPFELNVKLPQITVQELALAERSQSEQVPIKVPEIAIADTNFSYAKRNVTVGRIDIRKAHVDAWRETNGSINLDRLLSPAAASTSGCSAKRQEHETPPANTPSSSESSSGSQSAASSESSSGSEWQIRVGELHLQEAAIVAEDRSVTPAARFELAPLTVSVKDWSTDAEAKPRFEADITINEGGQLHATGGAQLEPLRAQLTFDLEDFALPALQPYLLQATAMTLHSGKLGVKGDLDLSVAEGQAPSIDFKGDVKVASLHTTDRLVNQDFVKWRDLSVSGIHFQQSPDQRKPARLSIERIVTRQPYARVVIAQDRQLNVASVLSGAPPSSKDERDEPAPQAAKSPKVDSHKAPQPSIRIKSVRIVDGSANFADYSIDPSFATGIVELNGSVAGLSSQPDSRAKVQLKGSVDRHAPVDIAGEVNLLSAAVYTDMRLNFRNMELTTFNPYSGKFAGYNISKGKLSTELHYHVADRKLDATHHIVLDNLEFGDKTDSKDAAPIPMKLAVSLLKDRNGVIDLQLPVSGSIDDPKFRLGPIIWKAFLGLLTKVVTAPFAALGALFGGGEEMAHVDFAPGSATLPEAESGKLGKLANALVDRPQLRLEVPLTSAPPQDGTAMAEAALAQRVPNATATDSDPSAMREDLKRMERAYREIAGAAPTYPDETKVDGKPDPSAQRDYLKKALMERLQPDAAALAQLGRERAQAVQNALLANKELDPQRVFITTDRPAAVTPEGAVRMEMKLE